MPGRRQAIIWTNAGILLIRPLGTNFNEMLIEILTFSFMKMRLKVSSAKLRPFCLGLNVLMHVEMQVHEYIGSALKGLIVLLESKTVNKTVSKAGYKVGAYIYYFRFCSCVRLSGYLRDCSVVIWDLSTIIEWCEWSYPGSAFDLTFMITLILVGH